METSNMEGQTNKTKSIKNVVETALELGKTRDLRKTKAAQ